ncbi:VCBS repeat containing protein [Hyalomma marginatum]|uniref:VCBS repeat containing protein n=1 Tax=Hyalomma marginatum TaxID=34627 RepID=A0A8S4C162_9ACAR|nr:VCBS repeat containing protein [Hyalomma marginatum]CAG7596866.1 VCBS repeat containing protein [Hyalomma marginatum]
MTFARYSKYNKESNNLSILIGNGDGIFNSAVFYNTSIEPRGVTVGDLNNLSSKVRRVRVYFSIRQRVYWV